MSAPAGTQVLIHKPTIIDGAWCDVPTVVRIVRGRIVEEWMPSVAARARETAILFAVVVIAFPPVFMVADWLRYS